MSAVADDHAAIRLELVDAGRRLRESVAEPAQLAAAREALVTFCLNKLLPHLESDERWLAQAEEHPREALLAEAMRAESRAMTAAVFELADAEGPCEAVAATRVLHTLLAAHANHEGRLVAAMAMSGSAPG